MLRSLYSGVSGMKNNQIKMDVIANNIANVNTTAFKAGRVRFQDILSQTIKSAQSPTVEGRGGMNPIQAGLGMKVAGIDTITNQGAPQPTGRPLDCAIDGEGYFVLYDGAKTVYSRDGAFSFDAANNIINSDGFKLMGYTPTDAVLSMQYSDDLSGDTPAGLNWQYITDTTVLKQASDITVKGPTGAAAGATHNFAAGTTIQSIITAINGDGQGVTASIKNGRLVLESVFDIDDRANPANKIAITNATGDFIGLNNQTVTAQDAVIVDDNRSFTDITTLKSLSIPENHPLKDGVRLNNFSIEANGTIKGVYDDGSIMALGKISMAKFLNPGGLVKLGSNNYGVSANSGDPNVGLATAEGRGDILQSTLEMSNVDLASEFTDMIITSRAFQANSRTITTSDEMLQELLNLKR